MRRRSGGQTTVIAPLHRLDRGYQEVVLDLSLRGLKVLAKQGVTALAAKAAAKLEPRIGTSK